MVHLILLIVSLAGAFALLFGVRYPRTEVYGIAAGVALFAITFALADRVAAAPHGVAIWREASTAILGVGLLFAGVVALIAINPQRPFAISAHKVTYGISVMFWTASALLLVALAVTA